MSSARLPIPGSDDNAWGDLLNQFLQIEHNADGTLKLRSDGTFYAKPNGGIPANDLASSVQSSLAAANAAAQIGGDLGGTATLPRVAKLQNVALNASTPTNGQVLNFDSGANAWVPGTVSSTTVSDATTLTKGIIQLAGDLGGGGTGGTSLASGPIITAGAITGGTGGKIASNTITDLNISSSAAIAKSKLASLGIVDSDVSAISESKITNLTTDLAATEKTVNKGAASGYTPLDSGSKVPIANIPTGATGTTVAIGNDSRITGAVQSSTIQAKGNLLAGTGVGALTNLAVGVNGQVLMADSTQPTGLAWNSPAATALVFNIQDYGATTSSSDNKTAIDAAITGAAASGGVVYFPPGFWKTTGQHIIPLNVSVQGAGKGVTTISHRGVGTYCFFVGSVNGGASPPNYMGKIGNFSLQGQSGGNGTGSWGQQVGIYVLNCLFFNIQDVHVTVMYEAVLIDGGDEVALGAGTFAGNGYVSNLTASNVYIGLHIYRWVTGSTYSFVFVYGGSGLLSGSTGIWLDTKPSTSTFINPSVEGEDMGFRISTSQQGITFVNPRLENCNTYVSWENNAWGHTVIGGSSVAGIWANGSSLGANTQINEDGWFPEISALPAASAVYRKAIYRVLGSGSTEDGVYICIKNSSGGYVWRDITANTSGSNPLLAVKTYNPASGVKLSTTANTITFQDVDATNLAITFTAPASGQVLVRLTGLVSRSGTSPTLDVFWNLRDTNGNISGTGGRIFTNTGLYIPATLSQTVSSLTPGQSYTWKWGHRASAAGADWTADLRVGGDPTTTSGYAPATMEVWSA
ncbi:MAG TPA: glycosyl hydrolase family 28-related protein [Candidatus Saccharimonadia bacterium]|nr:glycosyl hydrolase family 28-related protein [Candidatus Saccharimonadia bacterium]